MADQPMFDAYVLVHYERYLDHETFMYDGCYDLMPPDVTAGLLWQRMEQHLTATSAACAHRFLIDDGTIAEDVQEYTEGYLDESEPLPDGIRMDVEQGIYPYVPGEGWTLISADPMQVGRISLPLPKGSRVCVAGFARSDCVKRAAARLTRQGFQVSLDEPATLPLTWDATQVLLAEQQAAQPI